MPTPERPHERRGEIRAGVAALFRLPLRSRAMVDAEASEELQSFLGERIADLMTQGLSPEDARAEALRRLGHSETDAARLLQHSARTREHRMNFRTFINDLRLDVRYAIRTLRRDRTFALFAVLVAGLGIGACVIVFSIVNGILLRPLPVRDAPQLAWIANQGESGQSGATVQSRTLLAVREQSRSFSDVAGYVPFFEVDNTLSTTGSESARLTIVPVTGNMFSLLGVPSFLGRSFADDESVESGPRATILSYNTWSRRFSADSGIIGKPLILNGEPVTVVGVLPRSFDFGSVFFPGMRIDGFVPFPLSERTDQYGNTLTMIGRLRPGASVQGADREMTQLAVRLTAADPRRNKFSPAVTSLKDHVSGNVHAALVVLLLAVGVVMVIVCANLSHLLLARGSTRSKEVAVRLALGAGRGRISRQLLTESGILALGGAVIGLGVAIVGTRFIASLTSFSIPLLDTVRVDATAIAFAALLTLVAGLAFGLAPALRLPAADVSSALKSSSRGSTGDRRGRISRDALIVSEIALACMLVFAAGLLTRSFLKVIATDPGFRPEMVAAVRV
ncbi:MAG: ABC transporter permease, partial [Gemmatimonadaceae bacterium]